VEGWLTSGQFRKDIPDDEGCYYRLYTNHTMRQFLEALTTMVKEYGTMKAYIETELNKIPPYPSRRAIDAIKAIVWWFQIKVNVPVPVNVSVIPKDCTSSCKRICMFLRWMVRDNSPVDLGLWTDIIDKRTLIMPLDTHVMQEANRLGLISTKTTSMSTAIRLTEKLRETFPDDPLKGDFALFGLGTVKG
jgi:uncharacterized protein (TIGR02757 family)